MFNVGTGELLVILLVALLVLGPEKLPDSARKIGNIVGELRRMSQGFQTEIRKAMDEVKPDTTTTGPPSTPLTKLEPVADDVEPDEQRAASSDDPAA